MPILKGLNTVQLIGYLGRDPELRTLDSGQQLCRLSVATTRSYKSKAGEWTDESEWHRITIWGAAGEWAARALAKGKLVFVQGRLQTRSYDKDGVKTYTTEVVAENVHLLGAKAEQQQSNQQSIPGGFDDDDPIPF